MFTHSRSLCSSVSEDNFYLEDTYPSSQDFELGFRVRISSQDFKSGSRVRISSQDLETGFRVRICSQNFKSRLRLKICSPFDFSNAKLCISDRGGALRDNPNTAKNTSGK